MNSIPARSTGISTEPRIDWKGNDLATSCNFRGNDFLDAQVPVENCRSKCAETVGCTHFTWTQFNGGTCWMKRGLVSKNDAFYNNDSSMVCGVINNCLPGSTGLTLPWHKDHWAHSCNFCGNDLSNAKTSPTLCGSECTKTLGCTHFTWTEFNGGTCWMKKGPVSKNEAFPTNDSSMICGVINVCLPGNIGSTLPWDGNNSARSCDFCGNDLSNVKTSSEFCGSKCAEILECTHFTWTEFNGGTCWMKKGPVSKDNAFLTNDSSMICGVIKERRQTRAIGDPVSEIHTRIYPWDFASRSDDHVRIH
jgi:hypothetical protein